ncbi:MAG TPA: MFS transporter, partial [Bryobacteraceae bacterium]|nr:MFS transporter [Bryobacteraceae bacterium]
DYGLILAAFSLTYAVSAPLAGLFIDRVGLNLGISLAVGLWSAAGIATGFARGLASLAVCRAVLGVAQAGGVPAVGKAIAKYLRPEERALGNAVSQIGLGVGAALAPPLGIAIARGYGWPWAFLSTGAAGLLWIPLWIRLARAAPADETALRAAPVPAMKLLRDWRLWAFVLANVLSMTVYTLWSNWTTVYLVESHGLALAATAGYAAVPPLFFNLGGLAGGWLSLRSMRAGVPALTARLRVCVLSALAMLATAAVPLAPGPAAATAAICFSAFWAAAMSVNLYTMPLDVWGSGRAAFAVSMLTGAYGAMQAAFSPAAGALIDRVGFAPVCVAVAALPLAACAVLRRAERAQ